MRDKLLQTAVFTALLAMGISCSTTNPSPDGINYEQLSPFAASYEKVNPDDISNQDYDLLIVEPSHYNKAEVEALKNTGATVIGYLSVGEVGEYRWYFEEMKEQGFLGRNENWDSYYLDLADPVVYSLFFDDIIPEIMIRGFDGLFLDTVDAVAPYTNRSYLQGEMLQLIRQIRTEYPDITIVQNAGLFLLDSTASIIDAILIEDVATSYNFNSSSYALKEKKAYEDKVRTIRTLSEKHEIPFLIIDFATTPSLREMTTQRLDTLSYPYFINHIELNDISGAVTGNNY